MPDSENRTMWAGIVANPAAGRGRGLMNVEKLESALIARKVHVERALTPENRQQIVKRALNI